MENKDELKEIDRCYYSDDIMRVIDFDFSNIILLIEKSYKTHENIFIFQFMIFLAKLLWVQNHCVLDLMK